ncbi:Ig-like domain-containing protein [Verrucomicrobiota bacterium]
MNSWCDYVFVHKNRYSGEGFHNARLSLADSAAYDPPGIIGLAKSYRWQSSALNHHGDPGLILITDTPDYVGISEGNAVIAEGGAQSGSVIISRADTQGALDVNYQLSGSATHSDDYTSAYAVTSGVASFADGVADVQIDITPVDDSDAETNENVVITLGIGERYFITGQNSATVTIIDDDNSTLPVFNLSVIDGDSAEGGDTAMLELVRGANSSGTVTVNLARTAGTAEIADYNNADVSSVVFADSEMSVQVEVVPTDDLFVEGTEWLELSVVPDASYTVGPASSVTVNIEDDEPPHNVNIIVTDDTAAEESSDPAVFRITRDGDNTLDLDVSYVVDTGTTVMASDYNSIDFAGIVTIPGGSDYVDLTLVPVDDTVPEPVEFFNLKLFVPNGASYVSGGSSTASVSIADNDPGAPVAEGDSYVFISDKVSTVSVPGVLENDADVNGDTLTAVLVTTTSHGTLSLSDVGSFTYTPDPGFVGLDSFTYRAYDGGLYSPAATVTLDVMGLDFKTHRGTAVIPAGSTVVTLVNGTDYTLSTNSTISNAFIRLVNTQLTGGGSTNGASVESREHDAWIGNPGNLLTSVDITREDPATHTAVSWEIIEYVGAVGGANEMIVRDHAKLSMGTSVSVVTGAVASVSDTNRVVVFITGQSVKQGGDGSYKGVHTAELDSSVRPVFRRAATGKSSRQSYAVVEFTGANWSDVQRVEHSISAIGSDQVEPITAVDIGKTFMHVQFRGSAATKIGGQVWFSATDELTFRQETGVQGQELVVWLVENLESDPTYGMKVQHIKTSHPAGTSPEEWTETITAVGAVDNSSIMGEFSRIPRMNLMLTGSDEVTIFRNKGGAETFYTYSVVEWPLMAAAVPDDSDGDGLSDDDEINIYFTDPFDPDSDGDGMPDGWEVDYTLNPTNNDASIDSDGDGMANLGEYYGGTAANDPDSVFKIIKHSGHDANEFGSLVQALSSGAEIKLMWLGGTTGFTNDYMIYRATSLDGTWTPLTNYPRSANGTNVWIDSNATGFWPNIFYKITAPTN